MTTLPGRTTDYEYKINPKDKCMILVRPVGSLMGYGVYGTFSDPQQAKRILAALPKHVAKDTGE